MRRTTSPLSTTSTLATSGVSLALVAGGLALAAPALADVVRASGEVDRYTHSPAAKAVAPEGATARVHSVETGDGGTIVTLDLTGFSPSTTYGAHAHVAPCGDDPLGRSAGGHYQHVPAGTAGHAPTHPDFANPRNEVWLDVTTNPAGEGRARSAVDWQFRDAPAGRSVIIHEQGTSTADGTAGKRVACLDVAF